MVISDGFEFDADGKVCGVKSEGEVIVVSAPRVGGHIVVNVGCPCSSCHM